MNRPLAGASSTIIAKVKTLNGELKVKQLDINNGIGNDSKGIHLGSIPYPSSSTDMVGATLDLRAIAGIPDKKIWVETNGELEHQFIYLPITGSDGRIWLNNNLGADYANINKTGIFNPAQQAKYYGDHNAYGSLFEWSRDSDGHELINWTNSTSGAVKNTGLVPGRTQRSFIEANDPCPAGFHTPTQAEHNKLYDAIDNANTYIKTCHPASTSIVWYENSLRISASSFRWANNVTYAADYTRISIKDDENKGRCVVLIPFDKDRPPFKSTGHAVRCISDR